MDHLKWVSVMVIALLGASCQWHAPIAPLPMPDTPADSAEQIAERLSTHLTEPPASADSRASMVFHALASRCYTKDKVLPPQGVPSYSAELRVAEVDSRLEVRIWLTSPEEAAKLTGAVEHAATRCDPQVAQPFTRKGWDGTEVLLTEPTSSDGGDPATFATVVASRGGLLAEVSWWWPVEYGDDLDRVRQGQGAAAAATVLAAVGGDPAQDAPRRPAPDAPSSALASALPLASHYGQGLAQWPDDDALDPEIVDQPRQQHDLLCSTATYERGEAGGVPRVERWLFGPVAIREKALILPDPQAAEQVRRRMVRRIESAYEPEDVPCSWQDNAEGTRYTRIPRKVEPFSFGGWSGEVETLAVRNEKLPPRATFRDSAAQVALAVRRGSTVVYLRWQGPAGTDLRGALDRGRAELTRTLKALG